MHNKYEIAHKQVAVQRFQHLIVAICASGCVRMCEFAVAI